VDGGRGGWVDQARERECADKMLTREEGYPHRGNPITNLVGPVAQELEYACISGYGNSIQGSEGCLYFFFSA